MEISNKSKSIGWIISILGVVVMIAGLFSYYLFSNDSEIPIYAPFFESAKFLWVISGLLIILSKEIHTDEYIRSLKLIAFQWALVLSSLLVILNQSFYFFTDNISVGAIELVIFQIWTQFIIYKWLLKRSGE